MSYSTKNYIEHGGSKTVIGGVLNVASTGKINVDSGGEIIVSSGGKLKLGTTELKQATAVAEAAGENVTAAEFKALLDALKTAGLMASES